MATSPSSPANRDGSSCSLVDVSWELVDPCPDVHALFIQFNDRFFQGKLAGCEVRWSPRMTLCAGQCHYEGRGGLCSVRLSKPLLKLRPRKDLVETLLHEMIHAYLFVTENNKDHSAHGPNFLVHMHRINKEAGTRISVFHSFHAEVAEYKQHWWRCHGPCRERRPYFGYVKRASNRAPGPNDFWWKDHQQSCTGNYVKIKEPEGYVDKKKKSTQKALKRDHSGNAKLDDPSNKPSTSRQPKIFEAFSGVGHVLGGSVGKSHSTSQGKHSINKVEHSIDECNQREESNSKTNARNSMDNQSSGANGGIKYGDSTKNAGGIKYAGGTNCEGVETAVEFDIFDEHPELVEMMSRDAEGTNQHIAPPTFLTNGEATECPGCGDMVIGDINEHLDICLQ